ncbi:ATP-binding protein [Laspinema olomoucense]|uniref:ATP-binding protein n=1 Tax=Laspinema olomoucense TaxID=3231600 RepID=UPI0021BACD13|nr:ATP-binding protein [Laspinema sp. D3c]MCT7993852.1 ATP-binding protein [Laspinema sp. D3c]
MMVDLKQFFDATNPSKTLFVEDSELDQKYYIDFSSVRGGQIIEDLRDNITLWSPEEPTCQLFTGHIGCGKSTELLRLKAELEREGFHVVYFESSKDLEMGDVDVGDILLAIAKRVSESLDRLTLEEPKRLKSILQGAAKLLQTEIEFDKFELEALGNKLSASKEGITVDGFGNQFSAGKEGITVVAMGIAKITAKVKASPDLRSKLRGYLEPQTNGLIDAINKEILEPAIAQLKQYGKKGLVAVVDNLDRVDSSPKPWGRQQQEYLFVDRGEQLRSLHCHVVYTMPLALRFSNDFGTLIERFMSEPQMLPMVPVLCRDGSENTEGMALLRQMILARAFPHLDPEKRLEKITALFEDAETLDRLCHISGGHIRLALRMLNDGIKKQRGLPITRPTLEEVICGYRNERTLAVTDEEWELLRLVRERKQLPRKQDDHILIRSMFVYEYRDAAGSWFDINPILA